MNNAPIIFASIETTAFSGATLLAMLLGRTPDVATIGEISGLVSRNDPNTYLCSCGKKIVECDFWKAVTDAMKIRGNDFNVAKFNTSYDPPGPKLINQLRVGSVRINVIDRVRDTILFSLPIEKQTIIEYVNRNVDFVESVLETSKKNIFLDSSKNRMLIRTLPQFSDFDVRVIHLVRRVEGVVASSLRRNPEINIVKAAKDWVKRHRRIEITLRSWPQNKHILVRYEDLCQNTGYVLSRLLNFLNAQIDIKSLEYKNVVQHVVGNPMRLKPISEIKVDERWKHELSQDQLNLIDGIAGKLNRKYGYEES